jgi:hypothetical protein
MQNKSTAMRFVAFDKRGNSHRKEACMKRIYYAIFNAVTKAGGVVRAGAASVKWPIDMREVAKLVHADRALARMTSATPMFGVAEVGESTDSLPMDDIRRCFGGTATRTAAATAVFDVGYYDKELVVCANIGSLCSSIGQFWFDADDVVARPITQAFDDEYKPDRFPIEDKAISVAWKAFDAGDCVTFRRLAKAVQGVYDFLAIANDHLASPLATAEEKEYYGRVYTVLTGETPEETRAWALAECV